jgi:hypothetical protein
VKFSAEHLKRELEKLTGSAPAPGTAGVAPVADAELFDLGDKPGSRDKQITPANVFRDLVIAGPSPAPLLRAENFYRYHIMLRTHAMSRLSQALAQITTVMTFPDDVTLAVDIDPVDLS